MSIKQNRLFVAVVAAAAFSTTMPSLAASDPIERCRQADSDRERIACLEAALRGSDEIPQTVTETAQETPPQEPTPAAPAPASAPELAPEPDPIAEVAPTEPEGADLGSEQVTARRTRPGEEEPAPRLQAGVASAEIVPFRRLQVTLDNGHVWRQIRGDTQRINERRAAEQTVEIWESSLGGYRMRMNEMARTIRVERVR